MRRFASFVVLLVAGCGGGNGLPDDHNDMAVVVDMAFIPDLTVVKDLTPIPDLVTPYSPPVDANGFACGPKATCTNAQVCCISNKGGDAGLGAECMASCPDGGVAQLTCEGPGNCGGNPCCVAGGLGGGGAAIACGKGPMDCPPMLDIQNRAISSRLCMVDGDCTAGGVSTSLNKCCTLALMGASAHLCMDPALIGFIGGHCP